MSHTVTVLLSDKTLVFTTIMLVVLFSRVLKLRCPAVYLCFHTGQQLQSYDYCIVFPVCPCARLRLVEFCSLVYRVTQMVYGLYDKKSKNAFKSVSLSLSRLNIFNYDLLFFFLELGKEKISLCLKSNQWERLGFQYKYCDCFGFLSLCGYCQYTF